MIPMQSAICFSPYLSLTVLKALKIAPGRPPNPCALTNLPDQQQPCMGSSPCCAEHLTIYHRQKCICVVIVLVSLCLCVRETRGEWQRERDELRGKSQKKLGSN